MSIPPITPSGNGPTPPTIPNVNNNPSAASSSDNMTAYSSDITDGIEMTIPQFSSIMIAAANEQKETIWEALLFNSLTKKPFYEALLASSNDLENISDTFLDFLLDFQEVYNLNQLSVDNLNDQINSYNQSISQDQQAIDTLNTAISDYNAGDITLAQLQTAINTYNSYASNRNSTTLTSTNNAINTFNGITAGVNNEVELINNLIENGNPYEDNFFSEQNGYGLAPTAMPIISSSPPFSTINVTIPSLNLTTNTINPPVSDANLQFLFISLASPIMDLSINRTIILSEVIRRMSYYNAFLTFLLGERPYLPSAFYTSSPDLEFNSSAAGQGAGAGVSLGTITASLTNPLVSGIIQQGIFQLEVGKQLAELNKFVDQIQGLNLHLLSQIGLHSGSLALRLLAGRLPLVDIRSSPVGLATGIGLLSQINLAIGSGIISETIQKALSQAFSSLPATSLNSLTKQLATSSELFMLQAGLLQLAQAIGDPNLMGQVLSSIPAVQSLGILPLSPTISEILSDEQALSTIKNALSSQLEDGSSLTSLENGTIVNRSLSAALVGEELNQELLIQNLIQNGIDADRALKAAIYAKDFIQAEIIGKNLLDQNIDRNALSFLISQNQLAQKILSGDSPITYRELRDRIANELTREGSSPTDGLLAATLLVTGNAFQFTPVSLETLKQDLYQKGIERLAGLGDTGTQSESIAQQLVSAVLGPNTPGSQTSVRELLNEKISILIKLDNEQITEALKNQMKGFLEPTIELYAFAERLKDPANTFLLCAQTGLMYDSKQPSNYIKSVDIMV